MSVPSFRNSRSKVRRRRSHHALKTVQVDTCGKCSAMVQPHHACSSCGNYNNRQVTDAVEEVLDKKVAKEEVKEAPAEKKAKKEEVK